MLAPISFPLAEQNAYFLRLRIIFGFSIVLHAISLVFLVKYTPPKQAAWRNYMLVIQVWLVATDVDMELLIEPVPLFPAPAGFTTGILCQLGVPVQVEAGIGMLLIAILGASVILCVFHRHQTILVTGDLFKFSKRTYWAIHVLLAAAYSYPPASYSIAVQDQQTTDDLLEKDSRNLTWIVQRGCYFYQKKGVFEYIFIGLLFLIIISAASFMAVMFAHMNHVIKRNNHLRGARTVSTIKNSVVRIFFQLITPTILMLTPASIIFFALAADNIFSFEQCLISFTAMLLHPIVHNIFLISLTPSYRAKTVIILRRVWTCSRSNEVTVQSASNLVTR